MQKRIWFKGCAAAFTIAATVAAIVRIATPFAHAWWLVAYLALVGGLSQLLLGSGLNAITSAKGRAPSATSSSVQLVLWNVGTALVAIAVLAGTSAGVIAGSVLLLAALASFALSLGRTGPVTRGWPLGYLLLVLFL
ncbi:MAG TPA: hypothetical protein VIJ70_11565, partial [Gaiellaceae bacterium]